MKKPLFAFSFLTVLLLTGCGKGCTNSEEKTPQNNEAQPAATTEMEQSQEKQSHTSETPNSEHEMQEPQSGEQKTAN